MQAKVGTFTSNTSTGNQSVTGVGFTPTFVYFWVSVDHTDATLDVSNGMSWAFGAATSTTNRYCGTGHSDRDSNDASRQHGNTECIRSFRPVNSTLVLVADFVSFDADGFTINLSTASVACTVHYLCLDCPAYIWGGESHNSTGDLALTGAGFAPNVVLFFSGNRSAWNSGGAGNICNYGMGAGLANSSSIDYQIGIAGINRESSNNNRCSSDDALIGLSKDFASTGRIYESSLTDLDSDGITINITNTTTAYQILVGLRVPAHAIGTTNSPTSTGTVSVAGTDIRAKAALFMGVMATDDDHTDNSNQRAFFGGLGDDDVQAVKAWCEDSGGNDSMGYDDDAAVIVSIDTSGETIQDLADGTMDESGFTLDYTTADATARMNSYLILGDRVVYPDPLEADWTTVDPGAAIVVEMTSPYPTNDIPSATWATADANVTITASVSPVTATWAVNPAYLDWEVSLCGDPVEFAAVNMQYPAAIRIDDTHILAVWSGANNDGFARVLEVTEDGVTALGTGAYEFDTVDAQYCAVCETGDPLHFLIAWSGPGADGYAQVLVVDDEDDYEVTAANSALEFATTTGLYPSVVNMDDENFLIAWAGAAFDGFATVLVVDDADWSITAPGNYLEHNTVFGGHNSLVKLDSTHAYLSFTGHDDEAYGKVLQISGTTTSQPGSSYTLSGTSDGYDTESAKVSDSKFLSLWRNGTTDDGHAIVVDIDSSSNYDASAAGSELEFDTANAWSIGLSTIREGEAYLVFYNDSSNGYVARSWTIDGSFNITQELSKLIVDATTKSVTYQSCVVRLTETLHCAIFADGDDDGWAQALCVQVPPVTEQVIDVDPVSASWSTVDPTPAIEAALDAVASTWSTVAVTATLQASVDALSATWATVDPSLTLTSSLDAVSATWTTVSPTASLQAIADAVSASWSTVAVTHSWTAQPDTVSAAWSTVDPETIIQVSLDATSATWATVEVTATITANLDVTSASWNPVDVALILTSNLDPVSATWATVAVSSVLGASITPVTATWTTVGVDVQIVVSSDVVSATWSTADPDTSGGISVDPVTVTWSTATPGLQLGVGVVTATWSTNDVSLGDIITVDVVFATWATVDPQTRLAVLIDEALEAAWTVLGVTFTGPTAPQPIAGFICQPIVQVYGAEATVQTNQPEWTAVQPFTEKTMKAHQAGNVAADVFSEKPATQSCIDRNPGGS